MKSNNSNILKYCVFATGLSGIVAEYILATLATYFIGNSIVQWALIVSVMLFSMGLGSRLSKYVRKDLLINFISIEFLLSILVGFSALIVYTTVSFSNFVPIVIYILSISIGILIGMEIPIVIRMNQDFQSLRVNISAVMEHDYYGSLVGGFFFSFVGLPLIGMTYTPLVLGMVNFLVAIALIVLTYQSLSAKQKRTSLVMSIIVGVVLLSGFWTAKPIILFGEQKKYKDKIIYEEQSKFQKIVLTEWRGNYWLFLNGNLQFASFDEPLYHEPLVHPAAKLAKTPKDILIIGGGDGCAVRELLKYDGVESISLVDLDPAIIDLANNHPVMLKINEGSLKNDKVDVFTQDGFNFLDCDTNFYDVILIDLPDPRSVDISKMYSTEFYSICYYHLRERGVLVTQATSPYYSTAAFNCIGNTLRAAKFNALPMHNQILTMGEWGWYICSKRYSENQMKTILQKMKFDDIETKWINNEAMLQITSFGKQFYNKSNDSLKVNTLIDPILYRIYLKSQWDLY